MSAYDHVHPDFQHILLLSNQERLEFLDEPRWIGYHTALQIVDTLQGLLSKPVRPRMPNLLLVGQELVVSGIVPVVPDVEPPVC